MNKNNTLVAVYGTLREGFGNHRRLLSHVTKVGKGRTKDKYIMVQSGIPYVSKSEQKDNIVVEVYEVDNDVTLPRLDSLEGHPRWYRREPIPVVLDNGEEVTAELYFNEVETSRYNYVEDGDYVNAYK